MSDATARLPIEGRLAAAGLGPLPRLAWLEIDLDAIRANLAVLRDLAGPGASVRPVVKADAYGHGAVHVALALEAAGADGFCVATFDEAVQLRHGGIRVPIRVLYPIPVALVGEAVRHGIVLSAGEPAGLEALVGAAAALDPGPAAGDRAGGRDRAWPRRVRPLGARRGCSPGGDRARDHPGRGMDASPGR